MAKNSKIEWTDHTANFWHGCTKVSEGCKNCYAEGQSVRWGFTIWGPEAARRPMLGIWKQVEQWNTEAGTENVRRRVFVSSMADFFEDASTCQDAAAYQIITEARTRAFPLMEACENLDFLLLTKRPQNILSMVPEHWLQFIDTGVYYGSNRFPGYFTWPKNVWVGTSVEDQKTADERIPHLLEVNAPVRFLSMEPLLGPVDLRVIRAPQLGRDYLPLTGTWQPNYPSGAGGAVAGGLCNKIDWVIVGGESGPKARAMNPAWALSLRDQCVAARVPFFFKQWGEWARLQDAPNALGSLTQATQYFPLPSHPELSGYQVSRIGKEQAGRLLDGREWNEVPHA